MQIRFLFCSVAAVFLLLGTEATFPHAIGGLVTDIVANPLGVLAVVVLKKLLLIKLGLLLLGKRSIDGPPSTAETPLELAAAQDYEKMATSLDANGCIARLICEVMATNDGTSKFERSILKYFGETSADIRRVIPRPGQSIFHYAAFMGRMAKGADSCELIFQKCARTPSEVRKTANAAFDLDI